MWSSLILCGEGVGDVIVAGVVVVEVGVVVTVAVFYSIGVLVYS